MSLYERIESLRKKEGISQGNLEKELQISNGSISKWKTSMPKPERLQKVADHFGVTIDFLMGKTEEVECKECGQKYNPLDEFDSAIHETYHQKIIKAQKMYPSLIPYAEAIKVETQAHIEIEYSNIDDKTLAEALERYLEAAFSLYVYRNFDLKKRYDYIDFCKSEIIRLVKENSIPNRSIDYVLSVYGVDKGFLIETDTLLARASKNEQLMRILAYAEKLYPDKLDLIEIQLKALAEQDTKE